MFSKVTSLLIGAVLLAIPAVAQESPGSGWKTILEERLPLFGHRNWIVVADSAYPAQSTNGIETIVSHEDHFEVLQMVLAALDHSKHVRPNVYLDKELPSLDENDAPGISQFREQLSVMLSERTVQSLPHEQIIAKLAQVSQSFRVLIIKTRLALPYTSVFMQLDCAYWSADAERRLRASLKAQK